MEWILEAKLDGGGVSKGARGREGRVARREREGEEVEFEGKRVVWVEKGRRERSGIHRGLERRIEQPEEVSYGNMYRSKSSSPLLPAAKLHRGG